MPSKLFDWAHNRAITAAKRIDHYQQNLLALRAASVAWIDATEIMHHENVGEAYAVLFNWGKENPPLSERINRIRGDSFFRYETRKIGKLDVPAL